jgi:hypothetical protein
MKPPDRTYRLKEATLDEVLKVVGSSEGETVVLGFTGKEGGTEQELGEGP